MPRMLINTHKHITIIIVIIIATIIIIVVIQIIRVKIEYGNISAYHASLIRRVVTSDSTLSSKVYWTLRSGYI